MPNINIHPTVGKITYQNRCNRLNQSPKVFFFTGLSGAGKTTLEIEVERKLFEQRYLAYRLDGDDLRIGLNGDLGFEELDRKENIRRIAEAAVIIKDTGIVPLVCALLLLLPCVKWLKALSEKIITLKFM